MKPDNQFKVNLKVLIDDFGNNHVRWPIVLGIAIALAQIWLPKYSTPINATAAVLSGYGLLAAGNKTTTP